MIYTSESIERAVSEISKLPSVGKKTAQRLTYFLLRQDDEFINRFSNAVLNLKKKVRLCSQCFNYTDNDPCPICNTLRREKTTICVVEEPNDVLAIEKTNEFSGVYHVLHGVINPLDGISADDLKIRELIVRAADANEVILAINPSIEGEVTTQFIAKLVKPLGVKVSRIASGIPLGSSLEWTDEATLTRALEGRITL